MMPLKKQMLSRFLSTAAASFPKFEGSVRLLPMPHLSPHMANGKILKWYAKEGGMIPAYELIADIQPDQLTEILDERPEMEVELQEEMYIAKLLCTEGQEVKSGTPLAILCEMQEDIETARKLQVPTKLTYHRPQFCKLFLPQLFNVS
jgi:pyruvate/2-oxoglutarate dehydrogenase complex dihydrolipoamide acyltransferase (E2) component